MRFAVLDAGERVPDDFPLWLWRGDVDAIEWDHDHGDEGVYVVSGTVEIGGRECPAGGAVIVEAGVPARVTGRAHVVRVGSHMSPRSGGTTVHVVGPGGTWAMVGDGRESRYFADSECETCDINLFVTGRSDSYQSAVHSHSSDELIHVLSGSVTVGSRVAGPGSTLVIAADQRYGFKSTDGFSFLNYRPHIARMTVDKDAPSIEEGGRAHGFDAVMDVR